MVNFLLRVALFVLLLSFPLKGMAQEATMNLVADTEYTMGVSVCMDRETIDEVVKADKGGYLAEMWRLLSAYGLCGNIPLTFTPKKLIEEFDSPRGHKVYVIEIEVEYEGEKKTLYIGSTFGLLEHKA